MSHISPKCFSSPRTPPRNLAKLLPLKLPRSAGSLLTNRILYLQCHTFKTSFEEETIKPIFFINNKLQGLEDALVEQMLTAANYCCPGHQSDLDDKDDLGDRVDQDD